MPSKELSRLLEGYRRFREKFFLGKDHTYERLSTSPQNPKSLIIGCSDSRVDPALLSSSGPGDIFVVRNIANLVPPCEASKIGFHGVSAAIEFAIVNLKVENVIILGHRQCGGIRALLFPEETQAGGFVQTWMTMAEPAKQRALKCTAHDDHEALWRQCEREGIRTSIDNLRTFPFVVEAVNERGMAIIGIYFDIETGIMHQLDETTGTFAPVEV